MQRRARKTRGGALRSMRDAAPRSAARRGVARAFQVFGSSGPAGRWVYHGRRICGRAPPRAPWLAAFCRCGGKGGSVLLEQSACAGAGRGGAALRQNTGRRCKGVAGHRVGWKNTWGRGGVRGRGGRAGRRAAAATAKALRRGGTGWAGAAAGAHPVSCEAGAERGANRGGAERGVRRNASPQARCARGWPSHASPSPRVLPRPAATVRRRAAGGTPGGARAPRGHGALQVI
jgi:hypothetical protein